MRPTFERTAAPTPATGAATAIDALDDEPEAAAQVSLPPEQIVSALAQFERGSASPGERRAAEWVAARLRALGFEATIEEEQAHGGYWWPLGLLNAASGIAGLAAGDGRRLRRAVGAIVGALAANAVADDVGGGGFWFRRALLPHGPTWNVLAVAGDPNAPRTLVFVAHHDAAHSGLVFHPAIPRAGMRLFPRAHARANQTLPVMYGVWLGPALVALGSALGLRRIRQLGVAFSLGATVAMANVGASQVVPGANDNLSAVAVLLGLAQALRDEPASGVRVLLVSTGSEESFSEGMHGLLRRHASELPRETTEIIALECLGGRELLSLEGEGMLRMRRYDESLRRALADAARRAGVELGRPLRTVAATDALVALRRGWRTATLASIDETQLPRRYHWPDDLPDALDYETIGQALAVCEELVRGAGTDSIGSASH